MAEGRNSWGGILRSIHGLLGDICAISLEMSIGLGMNFLGDFRFRGDDYTDYYFRITNTQLTVNSLKIKAMEVYKS